ncbi:hypothetical protein [Tychonema sp. LEGE 07203]|nr:hypothetical protein [Tychonema sp. LEGE 07203]
MPNTKAQRPAEVFSMGDANSQLLSCQLPTAFLSTAQLNLEILHK